MGWWRLYPGVPGALLLIGAVLDFVTPPHVTLTPCYVAAPIAAAPVLSFWATGVYGLLATALVVLEMTRIVPHGPEAAIKIGTVASMALFALLLNRMLFRRDERIASVRRIAETVQRAVVPEPPDEVGPLRVAARYRAAQRDTLIGGDLYSVRRTPHGVRMLVGDVRGKGLGATEVVAVLLGAFREAAETEPELSAVAARMEDTLLRERRHHPSLESNEGFTTAVLVELPDDPPARLRMINRGHPPPVLLGPDGAARYLSAGAVEAAGRPGREAPPGQDGGAEAGPDERPRRGGAADGEPPADPALPLGLRELYDRQDQTTTIAAFPPGALLLLYTDGLSEARDADGVFYDPVAGLAGRRFASPAELLDALLADVVAHSGGGLKDDLALLAVQHPAARSVPNAEAVVLT
ncbi:PP2C family protein-serine/threonine phosphatase [Streptomyces chisholmiae]|uniref:PP2C family protein-serine/threonine phosphatase n=1 Tax=Streptomyces chisholmiae TaxID=3075540 RepID=UPI00288AD10E|nr:PP2C family protein-serine/threonine phosphatase [Streptomyces sp. DSM 44915]